MEAEPVPVDDRALPVRVVGIAASAGGVEAIRQVVGGLPVDFPAAVCVTLHIPATGRSLLAPILDRDSALQAVVAGDGMPLRAGVIYVAPADHHLLVGHDSVRLSRGPKENGTRPAADPMFRSLAESWGPCAVAVVLSGALDDGAAGAAVISAAGGTVVVQDPHDALVPSMPASAIAVDSPERVVPVHEMAEVLRSLLADRVPDPEGGSTVSEPVQPEPHPSRPDGAASAFTCPECSGALWELREGELVRYRCRVGHTYSEDAMIDAQGSAVEAALWSALEVLEERGELLQRIADRVAARHRTPKTEQRFREGAREALERAALIRRALLMAGGDEGLTRHELREAAEA